MSYPLVSIIIPVYNRADLLGSTLDSILYQTYKNWECIVVDDGSDDYILELMNFYCGWDNRIKFFTRPAEYLKGANSCRNYGFKKSRGLYIQWFDSDDLMVPGFLETKIKAIEEKKVDFVISKSTNFQDPDPGNIISKNEKYYRFDEFPITSFNYVSQKINWLTYDFFGKKEILIDIKFNPNLRSSQEYNFFCKLTCVSNKVIVIDEFLTLRRIHNNSIRSRFNNDPQREEEIIFNLIETWKDILPFASGSQVEFFFLSRILKFDQKKFPEKRVMLEVLSYMLRQNRIRKVFYYFLFKFSFSLTGRGLYFRKKFQNY